MVGIFDVEADPIHDFFEVIFCFSIVFDDECHELQFGDDKFGIIFDFIFMFDKLSNDDTQIEERYVG